MDQDRLAESGACRQRRNERSLLPINRGIGVRSHAGIVSFARHFLSYHGEAKTRPSFRTAIGPRTVAGVLSVRKWMEPSAIKTLTPPV